MLRLADRVFGEGQLHGLASEAPLPVGYELELYRDWSSQDGQLVPGEWVIEGHLLAAPTVLEPLAGRGTPFVLHLDDGRRLELFVLDPHGRIVNVEGTALTAP
ncbi:MAG TPA: hypothetical protein VMF13_03135 [Luteitalea sp.]|nr:hypothetical protein [Luteitalea sp.]